MATISYFGERLSPNILETADGGIVCRDAVIGRSGSQIYKFSELPQDDAKKLGLDKLYGPNDDVEVFRDPEEVFDPGSIASYEGSYFTLTHPRKFLGVKDGESLEKAAHHHRGHLQNVRKGDKPLKSGDWPLLADIFVKDAEAKDRILNYNERQLSCGYAYKLALKGNRVVQQNIVGNHVALVSRGRAGHEARIYDSAPDITPSQVSEGAASRLSAAVTNQNRASTGTPGEERRKENRMKNTAKSILHGLSVLGLAFGADEESDKQTEQTEEIEKSAKTEKPGPVEHFGEKTTEVPKEATDSKVKDAAANDRRARLHRSLDRLMDEKEESSEAEATDTDMDELKQLFSQYLSEEEGEPQHEEESEPEEEEEEYEAEDSRKHARDAKEARDSAEFIEPVGTQERAPVRTNDAVQMLKELRPFVARSKDKAFQSAFNKLAARANDSVRKEKGGNGGSYKAFIKASTERSSEARDSGLSPADQEAARLNAEYAKRHAKPISKEIM